MDDADWRPLESFNVGDLVNSLGGDARIESVSPVAQASDVFNIEVHGDHVFRILNCGVLVHNANYVPDEAVKQALSKLTDIPWGEYRGFGCELVANKIQAAIGGTKRRIKLKPEYQVNGATLGDRSYAGEGSVFRKIGTRWDFYDVVVLNGRVYDAMTGVGGEAIEAFKKLWGVYEDVIDFGF